VLFGRREPEFRDAADRPADAPEAYIDNNASQNEAVSLAVDAEDGALIHGPPGTGKTYTIARTIRALVEEGNRVLLSAFTNRAVDNALEALRDQGFDEVLRVGSETGVRDDMQDVRLVQRGDPNAKAAELRDAPVVAATTAACGSRVLRECEFDVALVDEASQLTEPGTHAAINRADRFVLVGDHEQLPGRARGERPPDLSLPAAHRGVPRRERHARPPVPDEPAHPGVRLRGVLRRRAPPATPEVAGQTLRDLGVDPPTSPTGSRAASTSTTPGRDPRREPERSGGRARRRDRRRLRRRRRRSDDIGVIAPFRAQVAEIGRRTAVTVDTVDRFQGSSKEVIVVSLVATGDLDGPIFEDHRRMNVALTRAKKQLTLVGDDDALASEPFYARMLEWAQR